MTKAKSHIDHYAAITNRIVASLEQGVRPWVQPWSTHHLNGRVQRPLRHNGEGYSGINVLLLWSEGIARGFDSPSWMTFRQALELGGQVRKEERGTTVIYVGRFTKTAVEANGGEVDREIPFLKTYSVFNVAQIDGLPEHYYQLPTPPRNPIERMESADRFFASTDAVVRYGGTQAFYLPARDYIQMPPIQTFRDAQSFVSTLSHEFIHWTSHPDRVGRDLSRYAKDRTERAREELIAEIGSAFLCADLDIAPELEPRPDHAAYIDHWIKVLKDDKRAIFQAAAHAQRAVAYLHNLQPQPEELREAA